MSSLPAPLKDRPTPTDISEKEMTALWHGLTDRQKAWVQEYLSNGMNATQAAKDAGYQASSESAFREIGMKNRRHDKIGQLVGAFMQQHMGREEALSRLAEIARVDMQDFISVGDDGQPIFDIQKAKERGVMHLIKEIDLERTEHPETGKVTTEVKLKLYDKRRALNDILDALGLSEDDEGETFVQLNQQINNYLEGDGDTPFDDVDNEV